MYLSRPMPVERWTTFVRLAMTLSVCWRPVWMLWSLRQNSWNQRKLISPSMALWLKKVQQSLYLKIFCLIRVDCFCIRKNLNNIQYTLSLTFLSFQNDFFFAFLVKFLSLSVPDKDVIPNASTAWYFFYTCLYLMLIIELVSWCVLQKVKRLLMSSQRAQRIFLNNILLK